MPKIYDNAFPQPPHSTTTRSLWTPPRLDLQCRPLHIHQGKRFSPRTEPAPSIDSDDLNSGRHEEQETVVLLPAGLCDELV
ncbi:hypothetical protein E2562_034994 [Oryza meyeriana var. granulata]|uniref:Uncharacterized protein n=1 Tax=Oryza meyeriana var. granulata TaxID=110450 RepID=A0A6G1CLV0_9ORYZ|nr:hypothetical protein E2562_034994 [Oryza meyeriana var. granulata]